MYSAFGVFVALYCERGWFVRGATGHVTNFHAAEIRKCAAATLRSATTRHNGGPLAHLEPEERWDEAEYTTTLGRALRRRAAAGYAALAERILGHPCTAIVRSINATALAIPFSRRIFSPSTAAFRRIARLPVASRSAAASRSAVNSFCGSGAGPAPSS